MKIEKRSIGFCAVALFLGATALSAQSQAAAHSFADSGWHAGNASGESVKASGASVVGSGQMVSNVAAVPLWLTGKTVMGRGKVLSTVSDSAKRAGGSMERGAEKMWDFSTDENAFRPSLAREHALPPIAPVTAGRTKDVTPAEAMRSS